MRKKMIEVAIPLDAINRESAREKAIRHGHPSTLHLWWARRPLAACRAVLFASLVDDPSSDPTLIDEHGKPDAERIERRRSELFALIEQLVDWDNASNEAVLGKARSEVAASIASSKAYDTKEWKLADVVCGATVKQFITRSALPKSVDEFLEKHGPPVLDPFAGGGSIPLEAQRLGLRVYASDLNPVPVLINKALLEFPPRFSGKPPINPSAADGDNGGTKRTKQKRLAAKEWRAAEGLASDFAFYAEKIKERAKKRIGSLYPQVCITPDMVSSRPELQPYLGQTVTVITWLWARTIPSPHPATGGAEVPLVRSFWLSTKKGKQAWVEPVVSSDGLTYHFTVTTKGAGPPVGTVGDKGDRCLLSGLPISRAYIRSVGAEHGMKNRLMAIVAEGKKERIFLPPIAAHELLGSTVDAPDDVLETDIVGDSRYLTPISFGFRRHRDLFTPRQLVALSTFCDVLKEVTAELGTLPGSSPDYARALALYLGLLVSKSADYWSNLCVWRSDPKNLGIGHVFSRQALSMTWDFAECNPFSESSGSWHSSSRWTEAVLRQLHGRMLCDVTQQAAQNTSPPQRVLLCTDPPYYDNVPYADLSDFFYVWLRRGLSYYFPDVLRTVLVPKVDELVADPFRQGGKEAARDFFEQGMAKVFESLNKHTDHDFPATIFYAFKQTEEAEDALPDGEGAEAYSRASTGWQTFLQGVIDSGWQISGTWPMRTELGNRTRSMASNALASSIVLVCRPRLANAAIISRRDFVNTLKRELPASLRDLQSGNIAPVDLAQAAIGPGMAVYSRCSKVLESSGERLTVRTALALINQVLDEVLAEQEGDYDADTRWSLKWFEQFAQDDGPFGDANTLATAMSIGINGLVETGIVQAKAGKVRLLKRTELMNGRPETWDPATDTDIVHWEVCQYLIHALDTKGEAGAAALLRRINARYPGAAETARELAYRLYTICERKKWAQEAMAYNSLIVAWPEIVKLAQSSDGSGGEAQTTMF